MSLRLFTRMFVTLAASLCVTQASHAAVVDFEDIATGPGGLSTAANNFTDEGLSFAGYQFFFVAPGNPSVSQPTGYNSIFMETAIEPVVITSAGGGPFDFQSVALGLGDFNTGSLDTVTVTGAIANCVVTPTQTCTVSANLEVGNTFSTFNLEGFTNLAQVTFGPQETGSPGSLVPDVGFLAFDNLTYAPVPEPTAWAMMIIGLGGVGAAMRRARRSVSCEVCA